MSGCGCSCDHGGYGSNGNGIAALGGLPIQSGDTLGLKFQYKEDNTPMALPEGYDLLVGIYDLKNKPLKVGRVSDGSIITHRPASQEEVEYYILPITHDDSMTMMGKVEMEVTITNADNTVVDHARQIVTMSFEQRRNNAYVTPFGILGSIE